MKNKLIYLLVCMLTAQTLLAEPMWIWKNGKITTEHAEFKKTFSLDSVPKKATIRVTCDNKFELIINGKKVASSSSWETPVKKDIAKLLQKGENTILVNAWNEGSMAGFIFDLKMKGLKIESDKSWQARAPKGDWSSAVELKKYGSAPWGKVFDKSGGNGGNNGEATDIANINVPEGFAVEKLYSVPKGEQGSWVGMTSDDKGRIIACDQYGSLYRVTLGSEVAVEKLSADITGAHGLLYFNKSLYVMVNERGGNNGLYRLKDTTGDDQFDKVETLKKFNAGGEHGVHSIVLSPDKKSIFLVAGNHSYVPNDLQKSRPARAWDEDHILPRMWDARGHAKGKLAPGGFIIKSDLDGKEMELYSYGFRNEFDAAFNMNGDLFTYDADMEWDLGSPWYRPTRVNHVVSGADYGWRSGSGKWPGYYTDSLPTTVDIGPGSPTGVTSGIGSKFPADYQRAIFINDWTYGTMYSIHMKPEGGSYKAEKREFVSGKPLPLTDVIIHSDGNMYFMIGGRRTQSGLYRVKYVGKESVEPAAALPMTAEGKLRKQLEMLHEDGTGTDAVDKAWPYLRHEDRHVRYAARVAIEKQPVDAWISKALSESHPQAIIETMVALARMGAKQHQAKILDKLNSLDFASLSKGNKLGAVRAYQLAFTRGGKPSQDVAAKTIAKLDPFLPAKENSINKELSQVLLFLGSPTATAKTVQILVNAKDDHEDIAGAELLQRNDGYAQAAKAMQSSRPNKIQISLAFALRSIKTGWTPELRMTYFSWFPTAKKWHGGNSFKLFIENIRKEALSNVDNDAEKKKLDELSNKTPKVTRNVTPPKGPGVNWTVAKAVDAVKDNLSGGRDFKAGENLFHAAACASCHRFAGEGGGIGPDITGAGNRYSLKDLMENIIEPSKVISDQYGSEKITKNDGSEIIGKVGAEENGTLYVMTNPYNTDLMVEIPVKDIKKREHWHLSSMPPGLVNALNKDELSDLVAYLLSAGNAKNKMFEAPAEQVLFNGQNLDGWEGDQSIWSVEDGVIVGNTHNKKLKANTFLVWKGEVSDFELTYEAKVIGNNNSGMMYRSQYLDKNIFRLTGNQCDLHPKAEYCGMLYSEATGRGIVAQRGTKVVVDQGSGKPKVVGKTEDATNVDITQWHTYKIVAKGNHLLHYVDGRLAIDLTDNHKDIKLSGLIGIQVHAGPPMKAYFKNIKLKKLK